MRPAPGVVRAAALFLVFWAQAAWAEVPPPLFAEHAAVASDHLAASQAGVTLLKAGGNAVDAACATALALGVVNPHASGIGGGGFALVYLAKDKKVHALDFREQAPKSIRPDLLFDGKEPKHERLRRGGLAVGVPGEVRGLADLVARFGKKRFADCVRPAERLSRGFSASLRLSEVVNGKDTDGPEARAFIDRVMRFERPLRPGDTVRRPELGRTLRRLRLGGPDAFYQGPIAQAIVKAVTDAGGVLLPDDLRLYRSIGREPIVAQYAGRKIFGMPPPSSGGLVIAETLGVLSAQAAMTTTTTTTTTTGKAKPEPAPPGSSGYFHRLVEALKHGFADRARLMGDTDFVEVPVAELLDPGYHRQLAARFDPHQTRPPESYGRGGGPTPPNDGGTAHLSVIDADGNAVALTTTVNLGFGAWVLAGDTGIVLNNQMDDFAIAPGTPNAFGLVGNAQNAIAPGKRPLSSMSPTLVMKDDAIEMAVGGAGGPTIITGVLQVMLGVIDGGLDVQAASAAPRVHHQWQPNVLIHEDELAFDVVQNLARRGHETAVRDTLALVNVVVRALPAGLAAAAEFRGGGAPAGY